RFLTPRRPPLRTSVVGRLGRRSPRVRGAEWWRPALNDVRPDIIHVHFAWAAAPVAFERLGAPTIVSFHGSDVRSWPQESARTQRAFDELLQELRYAIASSRSVADEVV